MDEIVLPDTSNKICIIGDENCETSVHLNKDGTFVVTTSFRWISVEDRLPKEGDWVLTFRRFIEIKKWEHGMFYDGEMHCYCPIGVEDGITHWMPLPEPPK